ncbi:hypothetical protein H0H81_004705 [Sphagnurus paluster]|uniref:Beta-galactosidase domain-containing protein n=1 Tax=Sphagnurus paluster TaxID=117069 RepID=A0A9P7FRW9_9AGAR|nr:hypothetical protein H0H81_004705 [Sphagnurus paluster]
MKGFLHLFLAFQLSLLCSSGQAENSPKLLARQSTKDESGKYVSPVGSLNFYKGKSNSAIAFDQHSLLLDGKRVMFFSGEFHPFRLPAPELWKDILEKFKAAGFNGVSVYWHWGLSAPNSKEVRFTEHNDLAKFYQVAKEVGILVVYPNGPVIAIQSENEYATTSKTRISGLNEHMQEIIDTYREGGLTEIPTIHNDKGPDGQYALAGKGKVDLYGWDGYPLGFDCNNPSNWKELSTQLDEYHQKWNPAEPLALFEWQGGAFSYWSGPGYSECYKLINEQFANVYYKNNYASGAALQNLYMTYGGTNWGNMHTHTIYSSYDYGAAIREDRTLTPKLDELKLQSYFLHSSPDYLLVGRIGSGTVGQGTAYSTSKDIYTTRLNSPSTGANFYIVRQVTNTKTTNTDFTLQVDTASGGALTIPKSGSLTLAGRESKIIVTNYPFGSSKLQYSTAEIMTWATFDKVDTLVAYALAGQTVEIAVEISSTSPISIFGSPSITATTTGNVVTISGTPSGITAINFGNKRIIVADKKTASAFWAPRLAVSGTDYAHYDLGPEAASVLVKGPYLVRSAAVEGDTLQLTGDLNSTTVVDVFAPAAVTSVTWNGATVTVAPSDIGSLRGSISFPTALNSVEVPALSTLTWKCVDSLPELDLKFDDSDWVLANKTSTSRPQKPSVGKVCILNKCF